MKKRIIAAMISAVLCISLLPYEVFANLQNPVGGISGNSIVGHTDGLKGIEPKVELMFKEPETSTQNESGAIDGTGSAAHGADDHYYQVDIKEHPAGRSFTWPESPRKLGELGSATGQTLDKGIPVQGLDNGKLYKMSIIPYHYHTYRVGENGTRPDWAKRTTTPDPFVYVLTDFDTRMEGKDGGIEVTWEDSGDPSMEYQIGYIQGDYTGKSVEAIQGGDTGNEIRYITSDEIKNNAEKYPEAETKKGRFRYTIKENITQGKIYSAYVISTTDKIGSREILQNRKTPKVVTAMPRIALEILEVGKDKIRLKWDAKLGGTPGLISMRIDEYGPGQTSPVPIATLYGEKGVSIGYHEHRKPQPGTRYQITLIIMNENQDIIESASGLEEYIPEELKTKPTTPVVPKPIGPNTELKNKEEFLVPEDKLDDVPDKDFWKNDHTFHMNMDKPPTMNFVWSAYKEDLSLEYDIWVTDDIDVITRDIEPIMSVSFANGDNADKILRNKEEGKIVGFRYPLEIYYNSDMDKRPLVPNKVYYVKIVAKNGTESSKPAIVTIIFDSDGEVFSPPMLSKPPLLLDPNNIGTTSITIGWLETWYEIMAKHPENYQGAEREKAKGWNSKVYTATGSAISFVNKEGTTERVLKHESDVNAAKGSVGSKYDEDYVDRVVNLGKNVEYEYKFVPYQEILDEYNNDPKNTKSVEEYIEMLMRDEMNLDQGWEDISPKIVKDDKNKEIEWKQHTQDGLEPNTSYVFFIRPYNYDYDETTRLKASIPTWVIGRTEPDWEMDEAIPKVPVLEFKDRGDTHISVKWEYNSAYDYEMVYSTLEDPDSATVWPFEISTTVGDPTYVKDGETAAITITGLFPETRYHIWIRIKDKDSAKKPIWSAPVIKKTLPLGVPSSPAGLGIAAYQSILDVDRDFKPVDSNHITVEWQRDSGDIDLDNTAQNNQGVQKEYKYLIEIADNPEFIDKQSVTVGQETVGSTVGNAEILSRNMVYFGGLIANRPYYVRAKTILIAHDQANNREIVKESDYTQFIRIITKTSQDEYDGGDNINEVIYPNKIEESYDGTTWTYEIKDTQQVINEMVTGNQFKYVIPVQKYRGIHDPKFRVVRIPQPVVTTLLNRRMDVEIRTNILSMQIPAKALDAYMVGTTADGMVEFIFETLSAADLYGTGLGYEYGFLSTPEKMSISIKGQKGIKALTTVDALLQVKINMPRQVDYMNRNLGGYTYDTQEGVWKKSNHQFDKINMQLGYTSGAIGTYAVYEKTRVPVINEVMSQSMRNVVKKCDIVGLGTTYKPSTTVGGSEYVNIMLGIAGKKSQVKTNVEPTPQELYRAKNSGLYISQTSSRLTQEAAISGVVRLYELIHGISVRPQTTVTLASVSPGYRDNIKKAYTLGLIYDITPGDSITYEELFDLIEQVIE